MVRSAAWVRCRNSSHASSSIAMRTKSTRRFPSVRSGVSIVVCMAASAASRPRCSLTVVPAGLALRLNASHAARVDLDPHAALRGAAGFSGCPVDAGVLVGFACCGAFHRPTDRFDVAAAVELVWSAQWMALARVLRSRRETKPSSTSASQRYAARRVVSSNGGGGYGSERVVEQHACSVRTAQRVR